MNKDEGISSQLGVFSIRSPFYYFSRLNVLASETKSREIFFEYFSQKNWVRVSSSSMIIQSKTNINRFQFSNLGFIRWWLLGDEKSVRTYLGPKTHLRPVINAMAERISLGSSSFCPFLTNWTGLWCFRFRVRAENAYGVGEPSPPSDVVSSRTPRHIVDYDQLGECQKGSGRIGLEDCFYVSGRPFLWTRFPWIRGSDIDSELTSLRVRPR